MEQPQVRINPETGLPEIAVFQPLNEADANQAVDNAQAVFDDREAEVEQLNTATQNIRTSLVEAEKSLKDKVEEKEAAETTLLAAKSVQAAIARARETVGQQSQPEQAAGDSEGAGEDDAGEQPIAIHDAEGNLIGAAD